MNLLSLLDNLVSLTNGINIETSINWTKSWSFIRTNNEKYISKTKHVSSLQL